MKKIGVFFMLFLVGCHSIAVPDTFTYREIQTKSYTLASWQKITDPASPVRIYIEGDGYAFNHSGQPTSNPTPRGTFLRKIAFNDPNANVVYLARPCQFITDTACTQTDWTTGRFSQKIISSTAQAVRQVVQNRPIIFISYSGGALLSGLIIDQNPEMAVQKWITIAGVLNHQKWTQDLKLPPLIHSVDLLKIPSVSQLHFVGDKDKVVSYQLTRSIVAPQNLQIIPNATHNSGFESVLPLLYR